MWYLAEHETGDIPTEWVLERLRLRRDVLLRESDWTQTLDAPVDQAAWAEYRQKLRDLPSSASDPRDVVWPDLPTTTTT